MALITEQDTQVLEKMVDKYDLTHVLAKLAQICDEKAEHVRSTWQDAALASLWIKAGNAVEKACADRDVCSLP